MKIKRKTYADTVPFEHVVTAEVFSLPESVEVYMKMDADGGGAVNLGDGARMTFSNRSMVIPRNFVLVEE